MPTLQYPHTPVDASTTIAFGDQVLPDPYRWLEDDTSAAVQSWQDEQDELAARFLRSSPTFEMLAASARVIGRDYSLAAPERYGRRWFRISGGHVETADKSNGPWVGEGWSTPRDGERVAGVFPSPDASMIAVGYLAGGSEAGRLVVVNADGEPAGEPALFTTLTTVAWLPHGEGFWFNQPDEAFN